MAKVIISPEVLAEYGFKMNKIPKKIAKKVDLMRKEIKIIEEKDIDGNKKEQILTINKTLNELLAMADIISRLGNWFIKLGNEWALTKTNEESEQV